MSPGSSHSTATKTSASTAAMTRRRRRTGRQKETTASPSPHSAIPLSSHGIALSIGSPPDGVLLSPLTIRQTSSAPEASDGAAASL
ncbi:hypothetical protein MU582_06565 [Nocardioidaceae bacterium SCSIO 66511]|nr:hypothetical protein MU582_06565 [Nocardioidaceae bacterium SCSIO 66511]